MKKSNLSGLEVGDVLLLGDGRLTRVVSEMKFFPSGIGYVMFQFMDQPGETMQDDDRTLDIERNLGQSEQILISFYTARSIHLRMNDAKLF